MSRETAESEPKDFTDTKGRRIAPHVAKELQTAYLRIGHNAAALRMWHGLLTEEDRKLLGNKIEECYRRLGTVGMWREVRDVSLERATIDVARGLDLMSDAMADRLLRELGEEEAAPALAAHPVWDANIGELRLGARVIRRVRVMRDPSNITLILDAFEAAGWPTRIENPLKYGQRELYEALRSLNRSLEAVRFRTQECGKCVIWERC